MENSTNTNSKIIQNAVRSIDETNFKNKKNKKKLLEKANCWLQQHTVPIEGKIISSRKNFGLLQEKKMKA